MTTTKQAFHHDYSDLLVEVTPHDDIATEALQQIGTIRNYLTDVGEDVAALAIDSVTRSILQMTFFTATRNKATAIYLCELFNAQDISVPKGLKDYRQFIDQFDGKVNRNEQ